MIDISWSVANCNAECRRYIRWVGTRHAVLTSDKAPGKSDARVKYNLLNECKTQILIQNFHAFKKQGYVKKKFTAVRCNRVTMVAVL